ncbi:MAG: PilT/PilU family type 4a pilus ATPase [Lawsonibacter sp.]|nr:PilT/PilU family type 4a pilus ATPase [Lawsonibacter sp.]MCI9026460.1 PilT/PilU family type 4a pilus ATPase [Lawsonibacter sp.]MCI9655547.1 PilT/PilU family type 4a pilus ATPase [Lawsonibacter sp.]
MTEEYVTRARAAGASDIHLVAGLTPRCRVDGAIRPLGEEVLTPLQCEELVQELAGGELATLRVVGEADLALTIAGVRCRLNLFRQQGGWSAAIRLLNEHIPDLSELGLPKVVSDFPAYSQGLVLITGETGSGKSTTLAAILNQINRQEAKHILTLEDPIEYVYTPDRCVINQREVGKDTQSFAAGLRAALREDPDVILVGEMRDLETIETALTAAETGHLVFGTVHTNSAADSIDRMVDVFPAQRQQQIRLQLSMTLKAVLSQQLLPRAGGGRVLACEVMKVDGAIRNLIREGKTPQIANAIQTTGAAGNILMDRCLQNLRTAGVISEETFRAALRDQSQAAAPANGARGTGLKRPL